MKNSNKFLLAFAAPCLVFISIVGFFHRKENERVQTIPALVVGIGLIVSNTFSRTKHRKKLLNEMRNRRNAMN